MSRPLRIEYPGAWYHVMNRGRRREDVFHISADYDTEIYLEKAFTDVGYGPKRRLPNAKTLGEASLLFLVHPTLGEAEMRVTCLAVEKVLAAASCKP